MALYNIPRRLTVRHIIVIVVIIIIIIIIISGGITAGSREVPGKAVGSLLVQEKCQEEKACDKRHPYRIIIIIIIIICL